jgi:hypothetical protein
MEPEELDEQIGELLNKLTDDVLLGNIASTCLRLVHGQWKRGAVGFSELTIGAWAAWNRARP